MISFALCFFVVFVIAKRDYIIAMYNSTKGIYSYSLFDPVTAKVLRSSEPLKNDWIDGSAVKNNKDGCLYYYAEIHTIHVVGCESLKIESTFHPYAGLNFFRIQDLQFDNIDNQLYGIELHDILPKSHDRWRIVKYEMGWPHIFVHEIFAFPKEMNYGKIDPTCYDSKNHRYIGCGLDNGNWYMFIVDVKSKKLHKKIWFGEIMLWGDIQCVSNDKGETIVIMMPQPDYDTITYFNTETGEKVSKAKNTYPILHDTISPSGKYYVGASGGWEQKWYVYETTNWTKIGDTKYEGMMYYMRYIEDV